jgi:DNA-dependent protein kinase catalytic subunit
VVESHTNGILLCLSIGWGKPDPSNHVHILSIHSTLGVLVSKQLPKQITLHCSDQNNYTFLVKGGEDLRLDQRIEQLFDVMNQVLSSDARCRDRNLRTKTYKVIPMTTEIGMIEWLHNTSTLKGIIERQLQQDPRCQHLQSNKRVKLQLFNTVPAKQYETFLMKQRGSSFAAKVAAPSRHDVTSNFDAVQDLIPADLLRRQLIALGADFEDFISIRDEFASSLAVFNACSYILGIGDRHLDNFLMDHATGRVIGIDFGVSFGAGASVLPVPELIPFRFTRQMESVLLPYDSANLVIQDMQAVFEALRDKKQVVESVMNVFLHEPLLDWQQSTTIHQSEMLFKEASSSLSEEVTQVVDDDVVMVEDAPTSSAGSSAESGPRKRVKRQSNSVSSASSSASASSTRRTASSSSSAAPTTAWLPDVKIAIARRKLDGLSPRVLLKEELAQNPHLGKQLPLFQALIDTAVVNGAQPSSAAPMSSLAQAQELVALATAPDLLGRTYHGWMPWL